MKKITAVIALLLAVMMLASVLVACGESKSEKPADDSKPAETSAEEQTEAPASEKADITGTNADWGAYTVLIPDGFELKEAGEFSSYDFSVRKSDFSFFDFNTEADDDNMMQHYNYNKSTYINEQKEFEQTWGANQWTGFQYSDGFGGWGFEAYTTVDGKIVRVSSAGFTYDSAEAEAVMASFSKK